MSVSACFQCPRRCGATRADDGHVGFCGVPFAFRVARVSLHPFEEPCLCGAHGAGTVFFCGCNLRCVYCQNRDISHGDVRGETLDSDTLSERILALRDAGAACLDLVTPTHYTRELIPLLRALKPRLGIPVVWNSGGYETVESLRHLEGLVDVYLPDCKYFSSALSGQLSGAPDYFPVACAALAEMLRQVGNPVFDASGILTRGVMVRHLVLPGHRADSIALLEALAAEFGSSRFLLSLMSQYTPDFAAPDCEKSLHRRLTTFEYESVRDAANRLGFRGYAQSLSSASAAYTPSWGREGREGRGGRGGRGGRVGETS